MEDGHEADQKAGQLESLGSAVNRALERRVIRKIDMFVIPFICMTYLVTYIDKAMLGYSAVFGLKESLDLHGTEYSWLGKFPDSFPIFYANRLCVCYRKHVLFRISCSTSTWRNTI